jgi:hypothetical protein
MNVICYGSYYRKRAGVRVKRLFCKDCRAYRGWLPPFLLPYKHYAVSEMLPLVKTYLQGSSGCLKAWIDMPNAEISFCTFIRWLKSFAGIARRLHNIASKFLAERKPAWSFEKDKRMHAATFPLSRNHYMNLLYQIFVMESYFVFDSVEREDFFVWLIFQFRRCAISPG